MAQLSRLRDFVRDFTRLVECAGGDEARLLEAGRPLLVDLITHDDWLPEEFARGEAGRYRQNLLYCDPFERFSVVSFVWGPGQCTPIHDHTVWGMVGVMRGEELCEEFVLDEAGRARPAGSHRVCPGQVDLVSPRVGDIHRVSNPQTAGDAVSIHVYGANIGTLTRHRYEPDSGTQADFVSAYSNAVLPNLWTASGV